MRRKLDFYPTPSWVVRSLASVFPMLGVSVSSPIFDPSAGDGGILNAFPERPTFGIELDQERADFARTIGHDVRQGNSLTCEWPECDSVLVGNPPYSHAFDFVLKANLWHRRTGNPVFMMLRLSFLEPTKERGSFLSRNVPTILFPHKRVSFFPGGTDSTPSVWFAWIKDRQPTTIYLSEP